MDIDTQSKVEKEDRPLTRADVEQLLHEAGSPDKLNLSGLNLEGVNLTGLDLSGAKLSGANLKRANLSGAKLSGANLSEADLKEANLRGADLHKAYLVRANLVGANLYKANLYGANLYGALLQEALLQGADLSLANLSGADLFSADLGEASLHGADLKEASLIGTNLRGADLSEADLGEADLDAAKLSGAKLHRPILHLADPSEATLRSVLRFAEQSIVHPRRAISDAREETGENASTLRLRIMEDPLMAQNLSTILSAFTELHTKCWLIAHNRLAELIEYTQTHNVRFAEEAGLVITRMRHNSPLEVSFSNLDPKNMADALITAIDGVTQRKQRLKKAELENQEKAEQIRQAEKKAKQDYQAKQQELAIAAQKAAQEDQMAQLEQEKQQFELERQRATFQLEQEKQKLELERQQIALLKERLDLITLRMNNAIEIAGKMVDMLQPNANQAAKAMLIQTLLPNLLQLQDGKGLELALPAPQKGEENTPRAEHG